MAPLKSFSELAFKKDKNLPNLKVPVKGKKGVSKYMRKAGITSKKPYDSEFRQRMVASVQSADRKPEKYVKPDGKVGINNTNPQSMLEVLESSTGQSETQKRIAIFRKNGTTVGDEGYIHLTTMTGHYGIKLGYRNEGGSPGYLNQGFFISTVNSGETIDNHKYISAPNLGSLNVAQCFGSHWYHILLHPASCIQYPGPFSNWHTPTARRDGGLFSSPK